MNLLQHVSPGQWCSFWDDEGDEDFRVGYLLGSNEDFSLFALVTTRGYDDGWYLTPTACITRIDVSDRYTNRIEKLFSMQKQEKRPVLEKADILTDAWFCAQAKSRGEMVSAYLETGETISGFISDWTDETVTFARIDEEGREDGISAISWDSIIKLRSDSGDERILTSLYRGEL